MKKVVKILLTIITIVNIIPIYVLAYGESLSDLVDTTNKCSEKNKAQDFGLSPVHCTTSEGTRNGYVDNGNDPMTNSFGLYVKMIHYDFEGGAIEKVVGNPVLIANDDLFKDISLVTNNTDGASGGGPSQVTVCHGDNCNGQPANVVRLTEDEYTHLVRSVFRDFDSNFDSRTLTSTYAFSEADLYRLLQENEDPQKTSCKKYDSHNYTQTVSVYNEGNIKYAPDGVNNSSNVKVIKVGNKLKADSNMLYNFAIDYFNTKGEEFDYTDFGITANSAIAKDMIVNKDDYYLLFEPVVRKKGGLVSSSTTSSNTSWTTGQQLYRYSCFHDTFWRNCAGSAPNGIPSASEPTTACGFYTNYNCDYYEDEEDPRVTDTTSCSSTAGNCGNTWTSSWWVVMGCADFLVTHTRVLTTITNYMESTIIPVRTTNYGKVMQTLGNKKEQDISKHINEELLALNLQDEEYTEYYVGPDLETALIGNKSANKYKFDNPDKKYTADNAKKYAKGALYMHIPDTILVHDCLKECEGTPENSDERLKCAENFYDNYYKYEEGVNDQTRILKSKKIIDCKYKKQQNNCEKKLKDADFLESIMEGGSKTIDQKTFNYSSKCNLSVSGGEALADYNYGYKAYCEASSFTSTIEENVHLDQEDFINVLCVERTSCGFSSLSGEKLTAGREITYGERAHLEKKCAVWFDNDSWKFYYASIPRNDAFELNGEEYNTRSRMIDMIKWYNKVVSRESGFSGPIGQAIAFDPSIEWEKLQLNEVSNNNNNNNNNNNESKLTVKTTVTEKYKEDGNTTISTAQQEFTLQEDKSQTKINKLEANKDGTIKTYSYERTVKTDDYYPIIFKTASNYDGYYRLPHKYCLALDKGATPINWDNKSGSCDDGTPPRYSYYLKLNTYGVGFNSQCNNAEYLYSKDDCGVPHPQGEFSCDVVIDSNQCSADDKYDIRLVIHANTTKSAKITAYGLSDVKGTINNVQELSGQKITSNKYYYGTLQISDTIKGNQTVTCSKKILADNCKCIENSCTIERDDSYTGTADNKYKIIGPAGNIKIWTDEESSSNIKLSDENTFYIDKQLNVNIYGRIDAEGICYTCQTSQKYACIEEELTCENKNDPRWLRDYCERSYKCDKNKFTSFEECYNYYDPGSKCPPYSNVSCKDGYYSLLSWCESHKNNFCGGDDAVYQCIQRCTSSSTTCIQSDKYVYRPIDNNCPFPNSYLNIDGASAECIDGERTVGTNWLGLDEKVITEEGNRVYNKAEYVIDLNPSKISEIKSQEANKDNYYQYKDARDNTNNKSSGKCHEGKFGSSIPYNGYCSDFVMKRFSVVRGGINSTVSNDE